ncbi:hypothetical protein HPB52_018412 [Rhipicephalus sanguineus]|uniref:Mediator of RNA polymerase II transcription subunit 25 n=1 Tax=Rhipicephalus sanguineus TaxID=34632 RepID=A0A9D4Q6Y1_RHISA|nr:hypothetical protein HPB52_018412 [Rhipicephalus sanguineus]
MVVADQGNWVADVVIVVEGTANLSPYVESLKSHYIVPTLEYFNGGQIDDRDCGYDNIMAYSCSFVGGAGESCSHIAEGLGTALQVFDDFQGLREPGAVVQKHCILVCNSPPYRLPTLESPVYAGHSVEQLASIMAERQVNFSILSPRKIPALYKLYEKAGGDLQTALCKNYAKDRRHMVLLRGYQLQERPVSPPIAVSEVKVEPTPSPSAVAPHNPRSPATTPAGVGQKRPAGGSPPNPREAKMFKQPTSQDASDEPLLDEPATPDGFATSDEVAASWTALRDAGVVPDSESFCDYVSADSEVVATEQLLDDDIVRAVNDPDETSDDDSADERARSDSVPKASNVPTASEALDAVDVLRRYYGAHEGGEDGMNIAAAAERAIVRIRKMQQRPITDFFAATAV